MSFLAKYLGEQNSGAANGDVANLANLANFPSGGVEARTANKPNSTNIVSQAPSEAPNTAAALQREARRWKVLQKMARGDQARKYHWITDDKAHRDFVILVFAIRDVGTGEIWIPREKYDPFLLMEILDKHQAGGMDS